MRIERVLQNNMDEISKLNAINAYRKYPDSLPDLLGIELDAVGDKTLTVFLELRSSHLNPAHTSCHAATMVALTDTACGWGCMAHLPEGAVSFTTVDLTCNLLRAVTTGRLVCEATMLHGGRTTQIWDATVTDDSQRKVAAFRCTELILYE